MNQLLKLYVDNCRHSRLFATFSLHTEPLERLRRWSLSRSLMREFFCLRHNVNSVESQFWSLCMCVCAYTKSLGIYPVGNFGWSLCLFGFCSVTDLLPICVVSTISALGHFLASPSLFPGVHSFVFFRRRRRKWTEIATIRIIFFDQLWIPQHEIRVVWRCFIVLIRSTLPLRHIVIHHSPCLRFPDFCFLTHKKAEISRTNRRYHEPENVFYSALEEPRPFSVT